MQAGMFVRRDQAQPRSARLPFAAADEVGEGGRL
jgi:hypothetical protein